MVERTPFLNALIQLLLFLGFAVALAPFADRKSTRLNSSH